MKKIYLLTLLVFTGVFASAQILDQFNYTGALSTNGWTRHSGTIGEFSTLTTASDAGNSLSYTGLATSTGNRAVFVSGNTEDLNKAITGVTGTGYYSFLMKAVNTTSLNAAGDHFIGFGATANGSTTIFGGRVYIKTGSVAGTFRLGIANTAAAANATYLTTDFAVGTTYFVVVKYNTTASPTVAEIFVNPVPGAAEPASNASNSFAAGTFAALASVYVRQGTNTGNIEIDEIRAGSTWASVTPGGCATVNNFSASACSSYTLNGTPYTTSGVYQQVLANANAAGCDSTINLTLTIKQPTTSTITTSACGSYTLNGTTYNTEGTYTQILTNVAGCDSTLTLYLTLSSSITYYQDFDVDGFGNPAVTQTGCAPIAGYVTNDDDCDDNNNAVGAASVTYYADADGDGFGNPAVSSVACVQPVGTVTNNTDCNDNNNTVGIATSWYPDTDGDTYGSALAAAVVACVAPANHVASNTDCNDNNNAVHPGATEIADNGIDEDCNGSDLSTALGTYEFTATGACPVTAVDVTAQPANATFGPYSTQGTTCASANNVFNNSAWNMTATVDLAEYNQFYIVPANCYSMDLTNMSFDHKISTSGATPFIHVRSSVDNFAADIYSVQLMNDILANVSFALSPGFEDQTDTVYFRIYVTQMGTTGATYRNDNVKVSGVLSALPTQTYYADTDGDGFGDPAATVMNCEAPANYVSNNTDCDDTDADEFPGAVWYQDLDGDLSGNPAVSLTQCTQPAGYVSNNDDCNDADINVQEGTPYFVDADGDGFGVYSATPLIACTPPAGYVTNTNDCDDFNNQITVATTLYYVDADGDGHGESGSIGVVSCTAPQDYVANDDDCNDGDNTVFPGAMEICDNEDNNCNSLVDEGLFAATWYEDADGDTFGNLTETITNCAQPAGYVANSSDCNDDNASVHPGATDIAGNGIDENCDNVDGYLALNENALGLVTLFPNPGTSEVTVKLNSSVPGTTVKLISADGKMISEQAVITAETIVNTSAVLPGIYFVQISNSSASTVIRWIKK